MTPATDTRVIRGLAVEAHESDHRGELLEAIRQQATMAGYMADLALYELGDVRILGGAEAWLLPPSTRESLGKLEGRRKEAEQS